MTEEILKKLLDEHLTALKGAVSKKDFEASFSKVLELLVKMEQRNGEAIAKMQQTHKAMMDKMGMEHSTAYSDLKKQVDSAFVENAMMKMEKDHSEKMALLGRKIDDKMAMVRSGKDGRDANEEMVAKRATMAVMEEMPRNKMMRDMMEKCENNALAVKEFGNEIKKLKKEVSTKSSGGVRRVFQPYVDDFSGDTDGSTKIFYLSREPLKTETILVWGTDFPVILRPNTDFTVSGKVLTLTSAVPAPNSGATLLIQYHA